MSSRKRSDQPWAPPSLLFNVYREQFSRVYSIRDVNLIIQPSNVEVKNMCSPYTFMGCTRDSCFSFNP